ncbi:MAG TPA: DUF3455 domain-containing protein [Polyangiaceae bacterium]
MMRSKCAVLMVAAAGVLLGGCSTEGVASEEPLAEVEEAIGYDCPEGIPAALTPAADQTIKSVLTGVGVQVYMCTSNASGTPTWTFVAPQANLLSDSGKLAGTHFIGPTWQGNDASSVVAARIAGATVDSSALPWLLLGATSHAAEKGMFKDVSSIQRLATVGGLAPTTGCDAEHYGSIQQVPYVADYVFYKTKTRGKVVQCAGE